MIDSISLCPVPIIIQHKRNDNYGFIPSNLFIIKDITSKGVVIICTSSQLHEVIVQKI